MGLALCRHQGSDSSAMAVWFGEWELLSSHCMVKSFRTLSNESGWGWVVERLC